MCEPIRSSSTLSLTYQHAKSNPVAHLSANQSAELVPKLKICADVIVEMTSSSDFALNRDWLASVVTSRWPDGIGRPAQKVVDWLSDRMMTLKDHRLTNEIADILRSSLLKHTGKKFSRPHLLS